MLGRLAIKLLNIDVSNNVLIKQLGWAFYLACSWTWCIGMFLPVILQNDFGYGAWALFIIFNIVGATAFSYVIANRKKSVNFINNHYFACVFFSLATILFQLFFIGWVSSYLVTAELFAAVCVLALLLLGARYIGLNTTAVIVWVLSILMLSCYAWLTPELKLIEQLTSEVVKIKLTVLFALPLLALGFLLCPYLDLTFHQVVQDDHDNTRSGNRFSFLVGFPLLFGALMLFSLMYTGTAKQMLVTPRQLEASSFLIKILFFYFLIQTGFTIIAHVNQLQHKIIPAYKLLVYSSAALALAVGFFCQPIVNEIVYRCFMSFYGIIAPAYVWMRVFNKHYIPTNKLVIYILLALLLAAIPMFLAAPQYYYLYLCAVLVVVAAPFLPTSR